MKILSLLAAFALATVTSAAAQERVIAIEGATLIDGTGAAPITNSTIVIRGSRIVAAGASMKGMVPKGAERIDAKGKFVIPGLIDTHIHLRGARGSGGPDEQAGIQALHGFLYSGVTAIYDAGNNPDHIFGLRAKERAGEIVSPRIFATGPTVSAPNGHGGGSIAVEDWVKDRPKLDEHIAMKPDMLKIAQDEHGWGTRPMINYMPIDLLEKVIRYYNAHGIRTIIHASNELRTWESIYAGIDSLAHPVIQSPVSERYLKMMSVKKIPQVSTLTIGEGYSRLVDNPEFLDQPLYRATLDPAMITRLKTEIRDRFAERRWTQWMKVMTPVAQENLRLVHEAGGIVALGTDQSLGAATHRELELLVDGGISPSDVIKIGTLNSAMALGKEDELGSIEAGKLADLVILNGDPTKDIQNAKRIDTVIKNGQPVDRDRLRIPVNAETTTP